MKADVEGRPKHLYSIYEKMVIRGKEFNEIHDLVGLRVLVPSLRDCYGALGAVHALWKPIPGRFKDYIAMPKSNMYQSLHTTVVGPKGIPLEIQIRTQDMHRTAVFGIAAHWRYKEGSKSSKEAQDMAWLGQMMDWLKDMADPQEFMEGLRIDLSGGRVFCFTPKGDVQNLPQGATPVDFAYSIHTEVGHRTVGAKVNGKLVPLDYELRTGDTVEILASKAQGEGPSQDWLQFVKTPRARTKIRQWFSRGRREDAMESGRDAVKTFVRRQDQTFKRLASEETIARVAEDLKYPDLEALYVAVGEGHVSPQSIVARMSRLVSGTPDEDVTEVPLARPVRIGKPDISKGVVVRGLGDVWVKLGRCCTPVPGDAIVGFVSRGQGVSVHRDTCPEPPDPPAARAGADHRRGLGGGQAHVLLGGDPGGGPRPDAAALRRGHGPVRQPREHPRRHLEHGTGPHHAPPVHVRDGRRDAPVVAARGGEAGGERLRRLPRRPELRMAVRGDWTGYYDAQEGREPRELLMEVLRAFDAHHRVGSAVDLGCGDGTDSLALLGEAGMCSSIDAQDDGSGVSARGSRTNRPRGRRPSCPRCRPSICPRRTSCSRASASRSARRRRSRNLWARIRASLRPRGRFAGELFGDRDTWASIPR